MHIAKNGILTPTGFWNLFFPKESNAQSANKPSPQITQATEPTINKSESFSEWFSRIRAEKLPLETLLRKGFDFPVDIDLSSPATRVMINTSNHARQDICLKMWLDCNNGVYNTGNLAKQTEYLLEGLQFNRRFTSDIYLGIVPILAEKKAEKKIIQCGPLIKEPARVPLDFNKPYALVMKRLDESWQLNHQLSTKVFSTERDMVFLAREIAQMHKRLDPSPDCMGTPRSIVEKLKFNRQHFQEALDKLQRGPRLSHIRTRIGNDRISWFRSVGSFLEQASKVQSNYFESFEQRHHDGHIRRCHGDLKATNLWLCPADDYNSQHQAPGRSLVILDCVDFEPAFCHIDTLSDVAMLAIDIEMRLTSWAEDPNMKKRGAELAQLFLNTYLREMGEKDSVRLLLEYYMTEKAMVCMYMSILYDNLPSLGEKYLNVVLTHGQKLTKYLSPKKVGKKTRPLPRSPQEETLIVRHQPQGNEPASPQMYLHQAEPVPVLQ